MGLGPVSKEVDEREGESRGLEGEQADPERKTIPPPHSTGPNPDKGLRLSPKARGSCVGWQAAAARCLLPVETPCLTWGLLPTPGQRLVQWAARQSCGTPGLYQLLEQPGLELS